MNQRCSVTIGYAEEVNVSCFQPHKSLKSTSATSVLQFALTTGSISKWTRGCQTSKQIFKSSLDIAGRSIRVLQFCCMGLLKAMIIFSLGLHHFLIYMWLTYGIDFDFQS